MSERFWLFVEVLLVVTIVVLWCVFAPAPGEQMWEVMPTQ